MEYTLEELRHELQHINNQLDPRRADWSMDLNQYIRLSGQADMLEEQIENEEWEQTEWDLRHLPLGEL